MTYQTTIPVDSQRVRDALKEHGLHFTVDQRDTAHLLFHGERPGDPDMRVRVGLEADDSVLVVSGQLLTIYGSDQFVPASSLVIGFQSQRRWPTARLVWVRDDPPAFVVAGDLQIPVMHGATDEQLWSYIHLAIDAARDLVEQVHRDLATAADARVQAPSATDLETWLHD